MVGRYWALVLLLVPWCLVCRNAANPEGGLESAQKVRDSVDDRDSGASPSRASPAAGDKKADGAREDEGKRTNPSRLKNAFDQRVIAPLVMPVVSEAMLQYRHVLAFSDAFSAASLAAACECDIDTALAKITPNAEHRRAVRAPLELISIAMQGEKRALEKSHRTKVRPLSAVVVIRRMEVMETNVAPDTFSQYLPCNDPAAAREGERGGIAVTVIWDGFPKGVISMDRLEATVWIEFLVLPDRASERKDRSQGWDAELRRLRFRLKEGSWVKE
jgi:hypothetical protein